MTHCRAPARGPRSGPWTGRGPRAAVSDYRTRSSATGGSSIANRAVPTAGVLESADGREQSRGDYESGPDTDRLEPRTERSNPGVRGGLTAAELDRETGPGGPPVESSDRGRLDPESADPNRRHGAASSLRSCRSACPGIGHDRGTVDPRNSGPSGATPGRPSPNSGPLPCGLDPVRTADRNLFESCSTIGSAGLEDRVTPRRIGFAHDNTGIEDRIRPSAPATGGV